MNWPGTKNSGPNPRRFRFLVGGILGPRQVGHLLDKILATCVPSELQTELSSQNEHMPADGEEQSHNASEIASKRSDSARGSCYADTPREDGHGMGP